MTWSVVWFDQAAEDLRRLHWETAARIDEAVQRLATTKEGPLRRVLINVSSRRASSYRPTQQSCHSIGALAS